jgi:hypothetical protein
MAAIILVLPCGILIRQFAHPFVVLFAIPLSFIGPYWPGFNQYVEYDPDSWGNHTSGLVCKCDHACGLY